MKQSKLILPCLRGVIGDWVYYSSVMSAQQVADWIVPVKDIRESKKLDEYLQRELKEEKKQKISKYLLNDKQHFFNSIIVGLFGVVPDWVALSYMIENYVGPASMDEAQLEAVSSTSGLMVFSGDEQMFALDGQHRVEGIKLAVELSKNGREDTTGFCSDQFSVIFVGHIDDLPGRKRSRKLFSDINKNAKQVGLVDRIKIDEEDINAIVSRRIFAEYPHFKDTKLIALSETTNLEKNDTVHFANLATLDSVCKRLKKLYKKQRGLPDWDEENIKQFYSIVAGFYDFMIKIIPEYHQFFVSKKLSLADARKENKYYLFRPIGLKMLANLYAFYYQDLGFLEENLPKLNFIMPNSPLNNVIWTFGKMTAGTVNQSLAYNLVLYMLNSFPEKDIEGLKLKYREITKNNNANLPAKIVTNG
ncbi:MAG: hypothetical protein JWP94_2961 [Mucilaginibacter sp.]|nr:hypothetical protein [Mucilaginibacter sp.]